MYFALYYCLDDYKIFDILHILTIHYTPLADLIALEQQKLSNKFLHPDEESDSSDDMDNCVARSKKYTDRNLFPIG